MAKKLAKIFLLLLAILLLKQAGSGQSQSITNDDLPMSMVTDGGNQLLLQNQNVWKPIFSGLLDYLFSSDSTRENIDIWVLVMHVNGPGKYHNQNSYTYDIYIQSHRYDVYKLHI